MTFGDKLIEWQSFRKSEKANSRKDFFDPISRKWKPGYSAGEMGYPLTMIKEILPSEPSPDKAIGPDGVNLDYDMDWTGQPGNTYFDLKDRLVENFKYEVAPENIILTNGTQGANFSVIMASIQKGDEVIIPRPTWTQWEPLCHAIGARVKILPLREELGWKWDMEELKEAISKNTKMILLCNPNNPTGRIYNKKELKEICELAEYVDAVLMADEEFRGLELDVPSMSTPPTCNMYYNAVSNQGVSKILSGAGIRVGWAASQNKDILDRANAVARQTGQIGGLQVILAWAANEPTVFKKISQGHIKFGKKSRSILTKYLKEQEFFECFIPKAGFLSFPGWKYDIDAISFVDGLFESERVRCWPGTKYGVEKHMRLGYGRIPTEMFKDNLRKIDNYIQKFI
jgi:aspartate/methionine/tyrosine aminotransferase